MTKLACHFFVLDQRGMPFSELTPQGRRVLVFSTRQEALRHRERLLQQYAALTSPFGIVAMPSQRIQQLFSQERLQPDWVGDEQIAVAA